MRLSSYLIGAQGESGLMVARHWVTLCVPCIAGVWLPSYHIRLYSIFKVPRQDIPLGTACQAPILPRKAEWFGLVYAGMCTARP